jgi:TonB-dependent starch-binding outer membrane protein SusC
MGRACSDTVHPLFPNHDDVMSELQAAMDMKDQTTRGGRRTFVLLLGLLLAFAAPAYAQHSISGRVTAAQTGEPLSGVQVVVRGTSAGTLTNQDGRYQLTAPSNSGTLAFTRIGYQPLSIDFSGQSVLNAELALRATELEGIVVIGYGEKTRANLTESVGTVSAEQIQRVAVASADQAIQGRVAGAQITTESGIPGAPVAVRIRGVGTVGNTQPLFVVDGVPVGLGTAGRASPLSTINPSDIESISVLKDASAASVYGMQAANGVVLITTRRGRAGKPTVRYDGYTGVQRFPQYYQMNDANAWLALEREALANANAYHNRQPGTPEFGLQHPDLRDPGTAGASGRLPELMARNTDWTRVAIHNNAPIMNHNMSISGASDDVNYFVSGGMFQQDAMVEKWDLTRYSFRANSDFRINDRIRIGETFSLSNQVTLRGSANYGDGTILNNVLQQPPIFLAYDPNLVSPTNPRGLSGNFQTAGISRANMNSTNQLVDVTDRTARMLGSIYGEVDVVSGLTFRSQNSVDYQVGNEYFWQAFLPNEMTGFERAELAEDFRRESHSIISTNTLNYTGLVGAHSFNVLGGVETNRFRNNGLSLQTTNFVNQQYELRRIAALGDQVLKKGGWAGNQNRMGYLGRFSYNFDDRYLLTASVRRDGVSSLAPGNQWGTFPAFSAGWRVSQEQFFNVPWIDEFKLRGSWGQLGNSNIAGGEYPHLVNVRLWAEYEIGGNVALAPTPQPRLANAGLTWETNETRDFGFESTLFNNAFDLAFTVYRRDTRDFLLNVPTPRVSGFHEAPINVGNMVNQGIELEAGYNTQLRNGLALNLSGNLTTVRNELESIMDGVEVFHTSGFYRTAVGHPVGHFFGYKTCGVFQTGQAIPYVDKVSNNQPQAGDMCFQDINGDGEITPADRVVLGNTIPDMFYGFNMNAGFRAFDLTAFFTGVRGVERYNSLRQSMESMAGGGGNKLATTQNRWTPTNPSTTMPRALGGDPVGNNRLSDRWIEDAGYLRLKTLQLGVTLPHHLLRGVANDTRVYVSGTNLFTRTNYSGLDPEFTTRGNAFDGANNQSQLSAGTDDGNIPQPRMFQVGISTSF